MTDLLKLVGFYQIKKKSGIACKQHGTHIEPANFDEKSNICWINVFSNDDDDDDKKNKVDHNQN